MRMSEEQFGELRSARERHGIPAKTRSLVRQTAKTPNQTETAFQSDVLYWRKLRGEIDRYEFEPLRLKLGNGVCYTPDFCVWRDPQSLAFYEVKGEKRKGRVIVRDDASVKIKIAASRYPEWQFVLVWREANNTWQEQIVLP